MINLSLINGGRENQLYGKTLTHRSVQTISKRTKTTPQGRQNLKEPDLCKTVTLVEK